MDGVPPEQRDGAFPPTDSGVFGDELPPSELSVIVGVGASLFDDRYGLASRKPRELVQMPFIANDRLDPALTHGDVSLTISASTADMTNYALRQLMRRTRGAFTLRWMLEGFNTIQGDFGAGFAPGRNLLGFKDGTANPDATDDDAAWTSSSGSARRATSPTWAEGGTYQAIRIIRMFVEFWDRTRLSEQEALIGRHKLSGAPLGGENENDDFDYADDADGERVAARRAHPAREPAHRRRPRRTGSCGGASATRAASTAPAASTRACCSARSRPSLERRLPRGAGTARTASRSRSTSSRSAAASSTCCPAWSAGRIPRRGPPGLTAQRRARCASAGLHSRRRVPTWVSTRLS